MAPAAPARWGFRAVGLSVRACVHPYVDQGENFGRGRILRPINVSKWTFYMGVYMYVYETNRNIQEP